MKRTKVLGLVLVAMFAMSALVVSAASAAAPEFKPVPTKKKFTDKSGTSKLIAPGGIVISCQTSTSKGEITGVKTVGNVAVTYASCTAKTKTAECPAKSPESTVAGTIITEKIKTAKANPLSGELGTTTVGTKVGEALKPATGEIFTEIEGTCIVKTAVTGSVIGEVTPINSKKITGELVFRAEPPGSTKQQIQSCSGGTVIILCNSESDILEAFGGSASLESKDEIRFEEELEVT
jgi:hypothetical protein